MRILILYPNSFPIGGAATNRLLSLCLGLIEKGHCVKVIISRPTERRGFELNQSIKGSYLGVEFEYATDNIIWPENKLLKFKELFHCSLKTISMVFKAHRKIKFDLIVSAATYTFSENLPYYWLAKITKSKLVLTIDEYPWVIIHRGKYSSVYRWFYISFYYKLFDGFIVMTKTLVSYYRKLASQWAKFIHIPMTVEIERFVNVPMIKNRSNYIAYCGNDPSGTKDGVNMLIDAFEIIKDDFPSYQLLLVGKVHPLVQEKIKNKHLQNRVVTVGVIHRDHIPAVMVNARALCLSRPDNLQADGGFPTKLGEYLAAGRPVVITDVGEITEYLTDGVNAFISGPDDVSAYAEKLKSCLLDPDNADNIGIAGRRVAFERFNFSNYSEDLHLFLSNL